MLTTSRCREIAIIPGRRGKTKKGIERTMGRRSCKSTASLPQKRGGRKIGNSLKKRRKGEGRKVIALNPQSATSESPANVFAEIAGILGETCWKRREGEEQRLPRYQISFGSGPERRKREGGSGSRTVSTPHHVRGKGFLSNAVEEEKEGKREKGGKRRRGRGSTRRKPLRSEGGKKDGMGVSV